MAMSTYGSKPCRQSRIAAVLTLAALLLPFDIAVRRLALDRRDFTRAWQRLLGRLTPAHAGAPVVPERSERMTTLLNVKERAGEGTQGIQSRQVDRVNKVVSEKRGEDEKVKDEETKPRAAGLESRKAQVFIAPKEEPAPKAEPTQDEGDGSTTSALLARKRERRQRRD